MQVQVYKVDGDTNSIFNVINVQAGFDTGQLTIKFMFHGACNTIVFEAGEWTHFIVTP